jgi:ABC-type polysaccharide/polyol phosphate export permease
MCIGNGLTCITENANLVKKVYFPRIILPLATTISNLVNFLLTLVVQFALVAVLLGVHGKCMSVMAWAVPLVIIFHFFFCFGIVLLLSSANVYFRDLEHLVSVLTTAYFFMTPAMYTFALVEQIAAASNLPGLAKLYMLNPMAIIIGAYRALILPGTPFPVTQEAAAGIFITIVFVVLAYRLFQKLQKNFSDMF